MRLYLILGLSGRENHHSGAQLNCFSAIYDCSQCGKIYKHRCNLSRHLRYECNKERAFICGFCQRSFKQNSHLKYHITHKHMS